MYKIKFNQNKLKLIDLKLHSKMSQRINKNNSSLSNYQPSQSNLGSINNSRKIVRTLNTIQSHAGYNTNN